MVKICVTVVAIFYWASFSKICQSAHMTIYLYTVTTIHFYLVLSKHYKGGSGGSVVRALARDRKVVTSTPGQCATE